RRADRHGGTSASGATIGGNLPGHPCPRAWWRSVGRRWTMRHRPRHERRGWLSMATSPWNEDDELLEELRAALRQAGTPTPAMKAAGAAAPSWATVDAELAALTYDSLVDRPVGIRGDSSGPRD